MAVIPNHGHDTHDDPEVQVRHGDLPIPMRSVLGIMLNRDSVIHVPAWLGPTAPWHAGDAHESRDWVCYQASQGADTVSFSMSSQEELGDGTVDRMIVTRHTRRPEEGQCGMLRTTDVATRGGLRLGLTREQVRRLLGAPGFQDGDSVLYSWEKKVVLPRTDPNYAYWNARRKECFLGQRPFYYICADITIRFDAHGVYEFVIERSDTHIC